MSGEFYLALKYADARIGAVGKANFDFYDSEAEIESSGDTYIESKYSEISIGSTGDLEIDSYDDNYEVRIVNGELSIDDKYSEFEVESAQSAGVYIYDGELQLGKVGEYSGRSKYSELNITEAASIDLERSYDDKYVIRKLGSFSCYECKYTEFEVGTLSKSARLNSYDDEFIVAEVSGGFEKFDLDCKYTTVVLPLDGIKGYKLDANSKYGSLKYPDPSDSQLLKVDDGVMEVKALIGAASSTEVTIKAYDSKIKLN